MLKIIADNLKIDGSVVRICTAMGAVNALVDVDLTIEGYYSPFSSAGGR